MDRDRVTSAYRDALACAERISVVAEQIGPLDTRRRADRELGDAVKLARQAVERLVVLLRAASDET